ncbi:MAG TPA: hypothetical protein VLA15_09155, partial [Desulfurivibrionaceae bacterium]|nr:hypothetical protein [Desulfurivibrionaceae bacterium]
MVFAKASQQGREIAPSVVVEFLKKTMPFNELDEESIRHLALRCRVDFFPKGMRLLTAGESELPWL